MDIFKVNFILEKLIGIYEKIFTGETVPTASNLISICLGIIWTNCCSSIKYIYDNAMKIFSGKKLNAFYEMLGHAENLYPSEWRNNLLDFILKNIMHKNTSYFIPISVDDTLVQKYGKKFQFVGKLFNHCTGNYISGFCFIAIIVHIPVKTISSNIIYLPIPIKFTPWKPKGVQNAHEEYKSKFDIVIPALKKLIGLLPKNRAIVVTADSWYMKGRFVEELKKINNVALLGAVRSDTAMFDLPKPKQPGTKGAPQKWGHKIDVKSLEFKKYKFCDYEISSKVVLTRLLGPDVRVKIFVTRSDKNSIRMFICTNFEIFNKELFNNFKENEIINKNIKDNIDIFPLAFYKHRWEIETFFYMIKEFWSIEEFKIRKFIGIERVTTLIVITYSTIVILPYADNEFNVLQGKSPQEVRAVIGNLLRAVEFLGRYAESPEIEDKDPAVKSALIDLQRSCKMAC